MDEAYSRLATKYDALMRDFDYDGYFAFIKDYLVGKSKGVDLCSGSGELTIRLAEIGKKIVGIDYSDEMLEVARKKARRKGLNIPFIEQDASVFELPSRVEFFTICCDGVNYIEDEESLYNRIYASLKKDGVLIFDYSTRYKLSNIIGNNIFYEDYEDYTYLWTNSLSKDSVHMEITIFNREDSGLYSREDEAHTQYIHDYTATKECLERIGFDVELFDGETYGEIGDKSKRALFVCKKRG